MAVRYPETIMPYRNIFIGGSNTCKLGPSLASPGREVSRWHEKYIHMLKFGRRPCCSECRELGGISAINNGGIYVATSYHSAVLNVRKSGNNGNYVYTCFLTPRNHHDMRSSMFGSMLSTHSVQDK